VPANARRDEVVVSAGGGAVGAKLVATALAARERSALRALTWRVLAGANLVIDETAREGVIVQRGHNDLAAALGRARVSVSQAGYNSVLEVAAAGARSVLVPFAAGGETEQRMRAQRLEALGLAVVVDEDRLAADTLAAAVDAAATRPRWGRFDFDCDGARRSAELIGRMLDDACRTRATAA
jgi:predicted glycosyltransferase